MKLVLLPLAVLQLSVAVSGNFDTVHPPRPYYPGVSKTYAKVPISTSHISEVAPILSTSPVKSGHTGHKSEDRVIPINIEEDLPQPIHPAGGKVETSYKTSGVSVPGVGYEIKPIPAQIYRPVSRVSVPGVGYEIKPIPAQIYRPVNNGYKSIYTPAVQTRYRSVPAQHHYRPVYRPPPHISYEAYSPGSRPTFADFSNVGYPYPYGPGRKSIFSSPSIVGSRYHGGYY